MVDMRDVDYGSNRRTTNLSRSLRNAIRDSALGARLAVEKTSSRLYSQFTFGPVDPASTVPLFFQLRPVRRIDWR
jgi:hypothetical protein